MSIAFGSRLRRRSMPAPPHFSALAVERGLKVDVVATPLRHGHAMNADECGRLGVVLTGGKGIDGVELNQRQTADA